METTQNQGPIYFKETVLVCKLHFITFQIKTVNNAKA